MDKKTTLILVLTENVLGSLVSTLCCILVLRAWYLMPHWRSVQNYISVNQILCGTAHITIRILKGGFLNFTHLIVLELISVTYVVNFYWSYIAIMLAYFKLAWGLNETIRYEKRIVTVSAFGMTAIVKIVSLIIKYIYKSYKTKNKIDPFTVLLITIITVSLGLFCRILVSTSSCVKKKISKRRLMSITSLIAVAIIVDFFGIISFMYNLFFLVKRNKCLWIVIEGLNAFRVVPLTIVTLLNKSSREHWQRYQQRRNRLLLSERI